MTLNVWRTALIGKRCKRCPREAVYGVDTKAQSTVGDVNYYCEEHGAPLQYAYDLQERKQSA